MYEIGPNSKPQMSLLCAQGLAGRKGRLLPYQPLLWARSFDTLPFLIPTTSLGGRGCYSSTLGKLKPRGSHCE